MIIKWTEGTEDLHEVVPVIWLTDDGFGCWYPSTGDVQSIAISYRNVKVDWTKVEYFAYIIDMKEEHSYDSI